MTTTTNMDVVDLMGERWYGDSMTMENISAFSDSSVLLIRDVFDRRWFDELLKQKGRPACVLNDHFSFFDDLATEFYCLPIFLEHTDSLFDFKDTSKAETLCNFNFMINKKQINRYLCLKMIEFFDLRSYDHTWSGKGDTADMSQVLKETPQIAGLDFSFFLQPVTNIVPKFIMHTESISTNSDVLGYGGNVWAWEHAVKNIFRSGAVALITDCCDSQKAAAFTEKTYYSLLGLNFPIWVGGYKHADSWKRMGFDIFEDVIDHSYQYRETVFERCYYAFKDNIHILSDVSLAADLRNRYMPRLIDNLTHARKKIRSYNDATTAKWPEYVRSVADSLRAKAINNKKAF